MMVDFPGLSWRWTILLSLQFCFAKLTQVSSGLWDILGGAVASGGRHTGMHVFVMIHVGMQVLTSRSMEPPFGSCISYAGTIIRSVLSVFLAMI